MDFSLKQALKVVVVLASAVSVTGTAIVLTDKNDDGTKSKNEELWNVVDATENSHSTSGPNGEALVSKTESQVGKYADIDGDGTVDGIIFADLLFGGSGTWNDYNTSNSDLNDRGTYTISTISSSKEYYVSQQSYTNKLGGTAEVLTPTGRGADRFYIMALSDVLSYYDWYNAAYGNLSDYNTITSQEFGKGKTNTATMISKWNNSVYGDQDKCSNHKDMWGQIQTKASNGWFVPSSKEFAVFAKNIKITTSNYSSKGLSSWYWTSSVDSRHNAYTAYFDQGFISGASMNDNTIVRLAATF